MAAQEAQSRPLWELAVVPAEWPLKTVMQAWAQVFDRFSQEPAVERGLRRAEKAVVSRLEDLWASRPKEVERWLTQHRQELYDLQRHTEEEQLECVLEWHYWQCLDGPKKSRFSAAGLVVSPWPEGIELEPRECLPTDLALRLLAAQGRAAAEAKRRRLDEAAAGSVEDRLQGQLAQAQLQRELLAAQLAEVEEAKAAELQRAREECGRLAEQLAAVQAALSQRAGELQSARDETERYKQQCQELQHRTAVAEGAVADSQSKLCQMQETYQNCWERLEKRLLMEEGASGNKADLQALLVENATFKGRCEQLQQNLAKAEAQASGNMQQMLSLCEEKGLYKGRCDELQRQLDQEKEQARRLPGGISLHPTGAHHDDGASSSQESNSNNDMDYILVDDSDGTSSVLSNSSWFSVKPHCFMLDAIFKTRSYGIDFFVMGKDLKKGSQVLAADDETILEVAEAPKVCKATEVVRLQAGAATLQATPDHPVQVPDANGELDIVLDVPAGELQVGDLVLLDSGEAVALTSVEKHLWDCEVLKIVFNRNLPVAVFSQPSCILSKGQKKKPPRRGRLCQKTKGTADQTADGGVSIPFTAGEYMD